MLDVTSVISSLCCIKQLLNDAAPPSQFVFHTVEDMSFPKENFLFFCGLQYVEIESLRTLSDLNLDIVVYSQFLKLSAIFCFKAFVLSVPSIWNVHMPSSASYVKFQFMCLLFQEAPLETILNLEFVLRDTLY